MINKWRETQCALINQAYVKLSALNNRFMNTNIKTKIMKQLNLLDYIFLKFFYIPTKHVQSIFNWVKCCTNAHTTAGHLSHLSLYTTCYGKHECKTYKFIIIFLYSFTYQRQKWRQKRCAFVWKLFFIWWSNESNTH